MNMENSIDFEKITPKNIPEFEGISPGHRACQGCAEVLAMRMVMKALGRDVIVISATGCMEVISTPYPETAWNVPWLHVAFENAGAVGSGVEAARRAMARKKRLAENKTKIVIMGGDGSTSDIGFQSLSGALERYHDFVYVCFDNEAYMNTGIQRSSSTPWGCWSTTTPVAKNVFGKKTVKKDLTRIFAAHDIPYAATATPAYHIDLMNKVRKAAATPGPAYIHILSPCPTGWKMNSRYALKSAGLAVQTRVFPLYEIEDGHYRFSPKIKKFRPVQEYLGIQGRFKHLDKAQVEFIQAQVDKKYADLEKKVANSRDSF